MSELNQLIALETDPTKKEILKKIKDLNYSIYIKFEGPGIQRWSNYKKIQKSSEWSKARLLLRDYFTKNGVLKCPICGKEITGRFTLHHILPYPKSYYNLFNPNHCEIIHNHCHTKDMHKQKRGKG